MIADVRGAGHPIWHFALVAGAALAVFVGIKGWELWESRRVRPTRATLLLAAGSLAASGVHLAVTAEHFREAFIFGLFFIAAASAQAGWVVGTVLHPSVGWLRAGLLGNAVIVTVWAVSRSVGVPIGPQAWKPEAVSTADAVCTQLEIAVAVGCAWLTFPSGARGRRASRSVPGPRPAR